MLVGERLHHLISTCWLKSEDKATQLPPSPPPSMLVVEVELLECAVAPAATLGCRLQADAVQALWQGRLL